MNGITKINDRIFCPSYYSKGSLKRPAPSPRPVQWGVGGPPSGPPCHYSESCSEGTMRRDLYAEVSARIIAELERGAAPWVKPWSVTPGQNVPQNAVTSRPY